MEERRIKVGTIRHKDAAVVADMIAFLGGGSVTEDLHRVALAVMLGGTADNLNDYYVIAGDAPGVGAWLSLTATRSMATAIQESPEWAALTAKMEVRQTAPAVGEA